MPCFSTLTNLPSARFADAGKPLSGERQVWRRMAFLPARQLLRIPSPEQLRKQAKDLLVRYAAGDPPARAEVERFERRPDPRLLASRCAARLGAGLRLRKIPAANIARTKGRETRWLWPILPGMVNAPNLDGVLRHPVHDNAGRGRNRSSRVPSRQPGLPM
jgi:hypothetical protein